MAVKPQIKANQLAKDLNLKSKDIVDIMAEKGIELKTQKSLEPHEFNVLFDALTSSHQIEGIDDYIDGVTFIPSKLEKAEKKAVAEEAPVKASVAEDKDNSKEAPKETAPKAKAADKPAIEAKAEAKPEEKAEVKAEAEAEAE